MPRFVRASADNVDPHRFEVYDCSSGEQELVAELAADVRALYLDEEFEQALEQAAARS